MLHPKYRPAKVIKSCFTKSKGHMGPKQKLRMSRPKAIVQMYNICLPQTIAQTAWRRSQR